VATEITITSRSGGKCLVRMVHSLFSSSDDWDDQMEGFEKGWPGFFEVLGIYLTHFAGQPAAAFSALTTVAGDDLSVWKRMTAALDLAGANVGERRSAPDASPGLAGVVERVHQDRAMRYITVRLDRPAPGIVIIGTLGSGESVMTSLNAYYYGDDAAQVAAASEARWRQWFGETFAAVQA
jgi:hypothetical protein